ncbi:MAG: J domain-containing protein [Scytolyngbya sp. HA4215-MV1]|nr:J domain-containing protein [Scytolyngbya sp. HA4215-MV1]
MNLADCYRLLGLRSGSSFAEVKASYRRLARRYHPDVNPQDQKAKDKFIEVTAAYKFLLSALDPDGVTKAVSAQPQPQAQPSSPVTVKVVRQSPTIEYNPNLSMVEQQLKETSYQQLQQLLKSQRFPRAIALVEGLSQRIPQDPEIRQWQAITYQRWGRHLVNEKQLEKARIYLKKALRTDPHNRSLWAEVEQDFRRMERIF